MTTLLERARTQGTPLIEGGQVTFVWEGEIAPHLMSDATSWWDPTQAPRLEPAGPGVWAITLTLPTDTFLEYAFAVDPQPGEDWNTWRALDPLNPRRKWNGINADNNYVHLPEAHPTPLIRRARGVARGQLTRHVVNTQGLAAGARRVVYLYRPAGAEPTPLVLVLDGVDYVRQARLPVILDNLIAQGKVPPLALVMPQNGRSARMVEYGCSEVTFGFFYAVLLPLARQHLNLIDIERYPGAYGVMGASMGGLMSLYLGLRFHHVFGHVLAQAGAYALHGLDTITFQLVEQQVAAPQLKIWQDCGAFDFLRQPNDRMAALLAAQNYRTTYRSYHAGHNYYAWRDVLGEALTWLWA